MVKVVKKPRHWDDPKYWERVINTAEGKIKFAKKRLKEIKKEKNGRN